MRIFKAIVAVLVIFSAITFWRAGLIERGELQTLQAPAPETVVAPPTEMPMAPETPTPEPTGIDKTLPSILSIKVETDKVNTLAADQWITITAHVTDDLSGFARLDLDFVPATGGTQFANVRIDAGNLLSGDKRDGIFWGTLYLPQHSAHGRWVLASVILTDETMNGCGEGEANGTYFQWESCRLSIEQPYFINGEDSGPAVEASPEPAQPSGGESADQQESIFLPSLSQ